ncbi:MAG: dUTP diphosphatase [Magnetovibrio sp.]|nr:dUTP diphosphatase [Magnetovibrio sp.]
MTVELHRLPNSVGLPLPSYATQASAGIDLVAAIDKSVSLKPGDRLLVPTGIALSVPDEFEAQIRPRSGLAIKHGITTLNSPGTIDSDYRGEIFVILINHGTEPFRLERGMRIAQLVVAPVVRIAWRECDVLEKTKRGKGGLGSTGVLSL